VRAIGWITEPGWEAVVDALTLLRDTEATLLYVASGDVVEGAVAGLLGRSRGADVEARLADLTDAVAKELLDAAAERLGGEPAIATRSGRSEREVLAAVEETGADVLVLARDTLQPGPRSIGHAARFVIDHAPCRVLLAWPGEPPPAPDHVPPPKKPAPKKPPPKGPPPR
jgi:nucleotide-binding universal stress UspA family protein